MATYQDIKGLRVKYLSADPGTLRAGEVWYNSVSNTLKGGVSIAAWSAGANTINSTNAAGSAQNATQTAGLVFGGRNEPAPAFVSTAEEYNGAGWSAGGSLNTARSYIAGFGIQTAAVAAGGRINAPGTDTADTEEYDGSTWTTNPSPGDMASARRMLNGGAGIITAGLGIGPSAVEEYGGTTWTASNALNTTRYSLAAFGTQTAALAAGGGTPPYTDAVEEYNGSSWAAVTALPAVRQAAAGAGTTTDGLIFGGELPGPTNTTFGYDGSTWTAQPNTAISSHSGSGQGTGSAALYANMAGALNSSEEFNKTMNVITPGAWASGPALNTGRSSSSAAGTETAGLTFGGSPNRDLTESYNGSSWTVENTLNTGRESGTGFGIQTAAVMAGGHTYLTTTENYDGTNWTSSGALGTGRRYLAGATSVATASTLTTS